MNRFDIVVRCYQHVHFIPIVGVGKEKRTLIGPWWPAKWQHPLLELS